MKVSANAKIIHVLYVYNGISSRDMCALLLSLSWGSIIGVWRARAVNGNVRDATCAHFIANMSDHLFHYRYLDILNIKKRLTITPLSRDANCVDFGLSRTKLTKNQK